MSSVNKVILVGRVGKDAEIKNLDGGKTVANFSLATSESYKDKDGQKKEKTEWHQISGWGKIADIAGKYVKKGDQISVIGKLTHRTFDKQDGSKGYTTEVVIEELTLLSGKKASVEQEA